MTTDSSSSSEAQKWNQWRERQNTKLKNSPLSFLNLNDTLYIERGTTVYLDPTASGPEAKLSRHAIPHSAEVRFDGTQLLLTFDDTKIDLMKTTHWQTPGGLVVAGGRLSDGGARVHLHNPHHPALKEFTGLSFFGFNPSFRVEATFTKADRFKPFPFDTVQGRTTLATIVGTVQFRIGNAVSELTAYSFDPPDSATKIFIPFKDATTGKQTYGTGRYLDAELPSGLSTKTVILDFNRAYNPLCARSPYFNCVRVPGDPLAIAVLAGEKSPHPAE